MKKFQMFKNKSPRSHVIMDRPTSSRAISFDDLYEDISNHWQDKAMRLQARRWRKIKHQIA